MTTKKTALIPTTEAEVEKFLDRAHKGDKNTLPMLHELLDQWPSVFKSITNLAFQAEHSLINKMAGPDLVLKETMPRKLREMRRELAGDNPTPLEKLLVERIVTCWLSLHYAELSYNQNMGDLSIRQAEYHQRRIAHCNQRYLAAIRTLAQVRRLQVPLVAQVNIAQQQVVNNGEIER